MDATQNKDNDIFTIIRGWDNQPKQLQEDFSLPTKEDLKPDAYQMDEPTEEES